MGQFSCDGCDVLIMTICIIFCHDEMIRKMMMTMMMMVEFTARKYY